MNILKNEKSSLVAEQVEASTGDPGKATRCPLPIFGHLDYAVVSQALLHLPKVERDVVILKFWDRLDSEAIARELGVRASSIEPLLTQAYTRLKQVCLKNPLFSRARTESLLSLAA